MNLFEGCHGRQLADGLAWLEEPPDWRFDTEGLHIVPWAKTDFFRPYQGTPKDNACLLYTEVTGDFTAVTHARAELVGFGDAVALTVRAAPTQWAKLCLERSPIGDISVVSVVTNPWSDDANNELLPGPSVLCGSRAAVMCSACTIVLTAGVAFCAHICALRYLRRSWSVSTRKLPFVGGCHATFSCFELSPQPVMDFRSGE